MYKVRNLSSELLDEINSINTKTKLKDRISAIYQQGGYLEFDCIEQTTMGYNLDLVDSIMPKLAAMMLLEFHKNRTNTIDENLRSIFAQNSELFGTDLDVFKN